MGCKRGGGQGQDNLYNISIAAVLGVRIRNHVNKKKIRASMWTITIFFTTSNPPPPKKKKWRGNSTSISIYISSWTTCSLTNLCRSHTVDLLGKRWHPYNVLTEGGGYGPNMIVNLTDTRVFLSEHCKRHACLYTKQIKMKVIPSDLHI